MQEKLTKEEREIFCREFIRTLDPDQAAKSIGREGGYALLRDRSIAVQLKQMRKAGLPTRQDVLRRLGQMVLGQIVDVKELTDRERLAQKLDLSAVTELKITDKGMEMKLIDRVQALETLWGFLEEGGENGITQFLETLKTTDEKDCT